MAAVTFLVSRHFYSFIVVLCCADTGILYQHEAFHIVHLAAWLPRSNVQLLPLEYFGGFFI